MKRTLDEWRALVEITTSKGPGDIVYYVATCPICLAKEASSGRDNLSQVVRGKVMMHILAKHNEDVSDSPADGTQKPAR